jgi:ubiquinone/menaquinone biosynthesis C-methylase UbiE
VTNTGAWDRLAAVVESSERLDTVDYGPDLPTERELRLLGDVKGKRVLDLGCGSGQASIALARQGAHAIALDASAAQLERARHLAATEEIRVEWHRSDLADLAFLRADSVDLAFSAHVLAEVEDLDRVFRQVHRVLRPGGAFVFSYEHPVALCVGRETGGEEGTLPLGRLELHRSYFERTPITVERNGEAITLYPRTIGDVFAAAGRAGFRIDVLLEPAPVRSADPGPAIPKSIIWRARKSGS